jgi:hypothetical protein
MLYGALVSTSQRSSEGFDRLSPNGDSTPGSHGDFSLGPNGSLFARWLQLAFVARCLHTPFGLSLSKALRGTRLP